MVVKIKQESFCTVDIEWEHNQSVQSLEASHFRDVSPDCVERVYQLFESGHTPSTARHQYLQNIRVSCKDGLDLHKKKAVTHQWCHEEEILITCTHAHNFAKSHWGVGGGGGGWGGLDVLKTCGKSSYSLRKRTLKQPQVTRYMKVIISHLLL